MRTPDRIDRDDQIRDERHRICQCKAVGSHRNETHQRGQYRSADNSHYEKRATQLGVRSEALEPESKDRWKHERHKKAGQKNAPRTEPAGDQHRNRDQDYVSDAIGAHQPARTEEAHEPGRSEAAYAKSSQRAGQKIAGDLFGLMSVLLSVRNEEAPGSGLCANIEKLCDDSEQKMRIAEKFTQVTAIAGLILVLAVNRGKFSPPNKNRPDESNRAYKKIGFHDAQRFRTKGRFVGMARLPKGDFLRCQLDARKEEVVTR